MIRESQKIVCAREYKHAGAVETFSGGGSTRRIAAQRAIAALIAKHRFRSDLRGIRVTFS